MALDFTFLKEDQLWGDKALDVMNYTKSEPTDLTLILGARMLNGNCGSWSASPGPGGSVLGDGIGFDICSPDDKRIAARPSLPQKEASKINLHGVRVIDNIHVGKYGEYPQTVTDDHTRGKLERLHKSQSLRPTGKNYTLSLKNTSYPEYEQEGKRYIRVLGNPAGDDIKLSTGEKIEDSKPYWVEVQPIEWLVDRSGWMVAKKCLFAGIQFDTKENYDGDFSKTSMKHYLDTYFAKEMEPPQRLEKAKSRQGLTALLDSSKKQPTTAVKKATKVAATKMYRSKNPKTGER